MNDRWRGMFGRRPNAVIGCGLTLIVLTGAGIGSLYTPYDPIAVDFAHRLNAPSSSHWLGTDEWGRDVISRLLSGAVVSVGIAGLTSLVATAAGALGGAAAAFFGRWLDRAVVAFMDA